jgi:hypothetical protein
LGIAHKDEDGRAILDVLRERRPPFQPKAVVSEFSDTLKSYGIAKVEADRYAGEWVTEAFREQGIIVKSASMTSSELYLNLLPLVSNGSVELLDNKRLLSQLAGLERRARSGGKDSISHFPGGHDDLAVAAAGSLLLSALGKEMRKGKVFLSNR